MTSPPSLYVSFSMILIGLSPFALSLTSSSSSLLVVFALIFRHYIKTLTITDTTTICMKNKTIMKIPPELSIELYVSYPLTFICSLRIVLFLLSINSASLSSYSNLRIYLVVHSGSRASKLTMLPIDCLSRLELEGCWTFMSSWKTTIWIAGIDPRVRWRGSLIMKIVIN